MTVTAYFGGHMLAHALASEPDARVHLPYPLLLQIAKAAVAAGNWAPPAGIPLHEALSAFAAGMSLRPDGEAFISDQDVEVTSYRALEV